MSGYADENHKRSSDSKIDEIVSLVKEIHQRQVERTIPAIEKIENTLYGNGKIGICEEVANIKTSLSMWKGFMLVGATLISLLFVFMEFIIKHK